MATRDGDAHAKALPSTQVTPSFLIHLNETEYTIEEPDWKKPCQ